MRMLYTAAVILFVALPCFAGSIGLYADEGGTMCSLALPQGESALAYVVARTSAVDPYDGYVVGGEFRIVGLPSTWISAAIPDAAINVAIGNPLGDGVTFSWPMAQGPGVIPLFTIAIMATTQEANLRVDVVKHVNPMPPFGYPTTCPWFLYACGAPCDISGTCADGLSFFVNGDCMVRVEESTWSSVRSMYR